MNTIWHKNVPSWLVKRLEKSRRHPEGTFALTNQIYSAIWNKAMYVCAHLWQEWKTVWLLTTNSSQKRVFLSHCCNGADRSLCEQWNGPFDCIVGFIEVLSGGVQPGKTSVFKSVKTVTTRISDRSGYPNDRIIIIRGIWRERKRGKGHATAWQNTHSIKLHMNAAWLWSKMEHQMLLTDNSYHLSVLLPKVLQKRDGYIGAYPQGCKLQKAENNSTVIK